MFQHVTTILSTVIATVFAVPLIADEPPPAVVQEKVREWVRVQKTISAERSEWDQQKVTMSELNEIRKKEIALLDKTIAAAGTRLADANKQQADLRAEKETLEQSRATLEKQITELESNLKPMVSAFPGPLLEKIEAEVSRLNPPDSTAPLQVRFRDVMTILNQANAFENSITVSTDLLEIEGSKIEVDLLYIGLHQAYYVDRTGMRGGTGTPGQNGWIWKPQNKLATEITKAIAIRRRETAPDFVKLPIQQEEAAP